MPLLSTSVPDVPISLVALLVARAGQITLVLAGPDRWRTASGYTMMPASLPGGAVDPLAAPADAVQMLALRTLGCPGRIVPSRSVYGRSKLHAIDRLPAAEDASDPLPLLHLERLAPRETGSNFALERVGLSVYLTSPDGPAGLGPGAAGLLWLAPEALRLALRGIPLADLLDKPGAAIDPTPGVDLPGDAFVFVPGDYGERQILRIAAKYGRTALFPDVIPNPRGSL